MMPPDKSVRSADSGDAGRRPKRSYAASHANAMIFVPILVAVITNVLIQSPALQHVDSRYCSLYAGIPWSFAALLLGLNSWRCGHRTIAIAGSFFWCAAGLFAAWVTIGFWYG